MAAQQNQGDSHRAEAGPALKSVVVGKSLAFARACLDVLRERDGKDRSHWLRYRAFDVSDDVFDEARLRLRPGRVVEPSAAAPAPELTHSITVAREPELAAACLAAWQARDGVNRRYMLDWKAINVSPEIYAAGRQALGLDPIEGDPT